MQHCCQVNKVQTFWPQTPVTYVICACYCIHTCTHTHTHSHTNTVYHVSFCRHRHTQEPLHEPNTTLRHATCVVQACWCVCVCVCACVSANVRGPGWSLLFRAGVCVSVSCSAQTVRDEQHTIRPHTDYTHTHTHTHTQRGTHKHMPYAHDQPIQWWGSEKLTQCIM